MVLAALGASGITRASTFPCRWSYAIQPGQPDGYVTAGINADCSGRQGSLTLAMRLSKYDPATKKWAIDKTRHKTFRNLKGNRYIEVKEKCAGQKLRSVFTWTVRDARGARIARKVVKSPPVQVPPQPCQFTLAAASAASTSP